MSSMSNRRTLRSHSGEHQVDVCPSNAGLVLSIGGTSIWLENAAAAEILGLLADALAIDRLDDVFRRARN
jgi:hypothetical protein